MVMEDQPWRLCFTPRAQKDARKILEAGLKPATQRLFSILKRDPWQNPPPFEKLQGDLKGLYSRRINRQHRLIYTVIAPERVIKVLALWTHYE